MRERTRRAITLLPSIFAAVIALGGLIYVVFFYGPPHERIDKGSKEASGDCYDIVAFEPENPENRRMMADGFLSQRECDRLIERAEQERESQFGEKKTKALEAFNVRR